MLAKTIILKLGFPILYDSVSQRVSHSDSQLVFLIALKYQTRTVGVVGEQAKRENHCLRETILTGEQTGIYADKEYNDIRKKGPCRDRSGTLDFKFPIKPLWG